MRVGVGVEGAVGVADDLPPPHAPTVTQSAQHPRAGGLAPLDDDGDRRPLHRSEPSGHPRARASRHDSVRQA